MGYTNKRGGRRFTLLQTLTGDRVDEIVGIYGIAEAKGTKLLDKYGWCWEGVVKAYESKGLTRADAILNRRLVDMSQWSPEEGISIWEEK